jgi:hypothetical protein
LIATDKAEGAANNSDETANNETIIASNILTLVDSTEENGPIQEESAVVDNKVRNSLEHGGCQ